MIFHIFPNSIRTLSNLHPGLSKDLIRFHRADFGKHLKAWNAFCYLNEMIKLTFYLPAVNVLDQTHIRWHWFDGLYIKRSKVVSFHVPCAAKSDIILFQT